MPGQTMRLVLYCAVLLAAVSSVMFGLDWMSAPMPPMPETKNLVFVAPPPPPPPPVAQPAAPVTLPAAEPAALPPRAAQSPPLQPAAPPPAVAAAPPPPKCDVAACAAAYRSFRESDCTYNPSVGPRRLCTKGVVPKDSVPKEAGAAADAPAAISAPEPDAQPSAKCNVNACAAAYRSFTEADCTYQPSNGPRRLCEK